MTAAHKWHVETYNSEYGLGEHAVCACGDFRDLTKAEMTAIGIEGPHVHQVTVAQVRKARVVLGLKKKGTA